MYRFFFGNIFGIFITVLVLYYHGEFLFGITPLDFDGLMNWVVSQNETTKSTIMGALITVVGFLIAYATATANWKSQLLATLKVQAAGEIEVFFAECSKLATDCEIYAKSLIEAVDKIQKGCSNDEALFLAHYNREQGQIFLQRRQRLVSLGIEVHRFHGKFSTLLLSAPGLKAGLDSSTKALENITSKLWISVPYHIKHDQNPVQTFVNQVNITECSALRDSVTVNHGELNFSSGSVRGNLMSTVVGFNFWMLLYLYKERKGFKQMIIERYKKTQING
jgi:hypothetical protein